MKQLKKPTKAEPAETKDATPSITSPNTKTHAEPTATTAHGPTFFGFHATQDWLSYKEMNICLSFAAFLSILFWSLKAYQIRLYSAQMYGYLIHEFDPWFNYRATEYMEQHGWRSFFHWFDYMSWYPLGRPVGTTIYPGLQITAVVIYRALRSMGFALTLTEVCVLIPAWFGALATLLLAALSYEATGSVVVAAVASYLFAIVPAHTMRSMAGEFDNECIAMAAMLLTFLMWVRSLRTPRSWPVGLLAGLAYGYMVAAWGGYIFVLNMVALHAGVSAVVDWVSGTYSRGLLRAYTLFFVVGTAIATRVPPVSMGPFKSLEQLSALLVLVFLWALEVAERLRARAKVERVLCRETFRIRTRVFFCFGAALLGVALCLAPTGYFGPLSSRVRALFVAHTRTGNPLVDSVAEHRPADSGAYMRFLSFVYPLWFVGTLVLPFVPAYNRSAMLFFFMYSITASYFCARMVRLILLAGPVACFTAATVTGTFAEHVFVRSFVDSNGVPADVLEAGEVPAVFGDNGRERKRPRSHPGATVVQAPWETPGAKAYYTAWSPIIPFHPRAFLRMAAWPRPSMLIHVFLLLLPVVLSPITLSFHNSSHQMARSMANPRIVFAYRAPSGETVVIRDYIDSYLWLKKNTPADSRVLSWWDYGYQITGIANRTTLADGNTWNHEHIATIGKMLTSPIEEAHSLVRHMADYVLVWVGQGGDLLKSPHMARIGNSVYRDICPSDPLCSHFGFLDRQMQKPTAFMRGSLLYHLHENGKPGVTIDPNHFQEVYRSTHGLVKIYRVMNVSEESKKWLADPSNRVCNPPGSWICPGQYPPAKPIQDMLAKRVDFGQLEDFNRKKKDDAYYQSYMRRARQGK